MIHSAGLLSSDKIKKAELVSFYADLEQEIQKPVRSRVDMGLVGVLAFFEPSTRTRVSFEKAGLDLGVRWIHLKPEDLSLQKGESYEDTFKTLSLYRPDFLVVRHAMSGFCDLVQKWTELPVFNAGDGSRDHPTQGLLDGFSLFRRNRSRKFTIAFFGDVSRSRVARADIHVFRALGYKLFVTDDGQAATRLFAKAFGLKLIARSQLSRMDVVVALRVQKERGSEYVMQPLRRRELGAKTLLMHPGPVILGQDLSYDLCDFSANWSLIQDQVQNGYYVRRKLIRDLSVRLKGTA